MSPQKSGYNGPTIFLFGKVHVLLFQLATTLRSMVKCNYASQFLFFIFPNINLINYGYTATHDLKKYILRIY
uniref:Uncharacterized protein n=1 Tax=Rhizophora mucronata TaxID=61149 RepID=A0A2P2PNG0_RHIMU